jgi:hypothetical protein
MPRSAESKEGIPMASIKKSTPTRAGLLAASILLATGVVASESSWAGRDAGQMIAQDKANRAVIARRQAALDASAGVPAAAARDVRDAASAPAPSTVAQGAK